MGVPGFSSMDIKSASKVACSVAVARYSTTLEKSAQFWLRIEAQICAYQNSSTFPSAILDLNIRVHCPCY